MKKLLKFFCFVVVITVFTACNNEPDTLISKCSIYESAKYMLENNDTEKLKMIQSAYHKSIEFDNFLDKMEIEDFSIVKDNSYGYRINYKITEKENDEEKVVEENKYDIKFDKNGKVRYIGFKEYIKWDFSSKTQYFESKDGGEVSEIDLITEFYRLESKLNSSDLRGVTMNDIKLYYDLLYINELSFVVDAYKLYRNVMVEYGNGVNVADFYNEINASSFFEKNGWNINFERNEDTTTFFMELIPSEECSYYSGNIEEAKNRAEGQIILDAYNDKIAEITVEFTSAEEKDNTYYLFGKYHKIDKFGDTVTSKFEIEYKFENGIYYTNNIEYA